MFGARSMVHLFWIGYHHNYVYHQQIASEAAAPRKQTYVTSQEELAAHASLCTPKEYPAADLCLHRVSGPSTERRLRTSCVSMLID